MKLRYLLSALAGLALFTACVEEDPVAQYDLAIDLDKSVVAIGPAGGTATVTVNSGEFSWTAEAKTKKEDGNWITFTPASGKGETKVTITVGESDNDRTGEIVLKVAEIERYITVVQTGDPHGLTPEDPLTCAEAIAICEQLADKAKTPKKYYVHGIISAVTYTFSVEYGTATFNMSDNGEKDNSFQAYGVYYLENKPYDDTSKPNISKGDEVMVYGLLMNYGGTPETSNKEAYLYSLKSNTDPALNCTAPEKTVAASDTEAKFVIEPRNLTEGWTVTTTADWITEYTQRGAATDTEIAVKFAANTVAEDRTATFTVKSAGAPDLTLTLKQLAYQETGTADKPYTVAEALEVINALADGATTEAEVYVSGVINEVQSVDTGSYGNASYLISDTGSAEQVLTVFRGYYLENAKFSAEDQIAKGDVVVVKGKLQKYVKDAVTTPEIAAKNYLHSLARPMTVAAALAEIATMADGATAETEVYIKGIVTGTPNVDTGSYGNATFDIVDAAGSTDKLTIFRAYSFGNEKFTSADVFNVGDEVIVIGKLQRYVKDAVMTPEVSKGHLVAVFAGSGVQPEQVPALFLNEFQCKPDKRIEIYNSTDAEVDMTGWVLLKNDGEEGAKDTFVIPENMAKVPAKGFAVFNCKQSDVANGPLFGLSGDGGFKIALMKGNTVVDVVDNLTSITVIPDGQSWGRETDGADKFVIFDTPTIGASNGAAPAPAAPKTIAELLAAIPSTATGNNTAVEVDVDFTDPVTVSYVNGKNAYLEDATGAILLYLDNHGLQAGFTIKGQLKVKGYWYNGIPELVSFSGTPTVGQGTVPETAVTIAQLLADYNKYLLRRVKLTDVKVTDGIADGDRNGSIAQADGSTIAVYAQINNGGLVLTAGDQGNLLTIPGLYNANKQVYFWQNDWWESTATDLPPTITIADITGVPAAGVTDATATVTFANNEGWEATATPDGTVVTAASIDGTTLKYTVAENTAYQARDGKITITLKKDGKDNVTKDVKVSQKAAESTTLAVGTVLWSENWDGAAANDEVDTYNYKSTTVFGGGNVTYTFTDAGTNTKMYVDNQLTGGENDANLLVSKGNGSFAVAGLPAAGVAKATLTIWVSNKNYPLVLSTTTEGVTLGERTSYGESSKPYKYTWEITLSGVTTFDLTLTNTYSSNNRLDNMSLVVTELADEPAGDNGSGIPDYDPINGFTW